MVLCVVGDVKPDEIAAIAEEILPESRGEVIERDYGQEDMRVVEKCRREAMEVSMPQFLVGFKCPPAADGAALMRQDIIADIACDILLGDSSPLYQRLYDKGLINGSFGGGFDQLPGIAYLYAGGDSNEPETVVRAILDEAQRLAREGVDEAFYQQIRRASFGSTLRALNSFENIAVSVADGAFRGFDPFRFPEVYDSVTRTDVEAFLRESIVEERSALSILIPKKAAELPNEELSRNADISFPGLFGDWRFTLSPKLLDIGNGIYWYGVLIAAGLLIALWFCMKRAPRLRL